MWAQRAILPKSPSAPGRDAGVEIWKRWWLSCHQMHTAYRYVNWAFQKWRILSKVAKPESNSTNEPCRFAFTTEYIDSHVEKKRVSWSWTETCVQQQEMAVGEREMKRRDPGAMGVAASSPRGRMMLVFSSPYSTEGTWPPATADHPTQPASYWFICSNFIKCLYRARNWDDCWELNV